MIVVIDCIVALSVDNLIGFISRGKASKSFKPLSPGSLMCRLREIRPLTYVTYVINQNTAVSQVSVGPYLLHIAVYTLYKQDMLFSAD